MHGCQVEVHVVSAARTLFLRKFCRVLNCLYETTLLLSHIHFEFSNKTCICICILYSLHMLACLLLAGRSYAEQLRYKSDRWITVRIELDESAKA